MEFVIYEKVEYEVEVDEEVLFKILFGEGVIVYCVMCESDDMFIGFVVYFFNYFMW